MIDSTASLEGEVSVIKRSKRLNTYSRQICAFPRAPQWLSVQPQRKTVDVPNFAELRKQPLEGVPNAKTIAYF